VVFLHGGSRRQMLLGFHPLEVYSNAYAMNQYLAAQGYVVLAVNYRSGTGYGLKFREAIGYGATGASELNDVLGAGLYLKNRADVDPNRIGLWGKSYGGYLTALALARASKLFAAGVDINGVHDWNDELQRHAPIFDDQGKFAASTRLAFESSPLAWVSTWRSPVLLVHGDDDRNDPFGQTTGLIRALREQGIGFEQLVFANEVHAFLLHRHWIEVYRTMADFLRRKL
jgi:dipeptidyl aminopeptidase/acylaminoacyl peptidase